MSSPAALGVSLGAIRQETHDLILAAALISISLHSFVLKLIDRMGAAPDPTRLKAAAGAATDSTAGPPTDLPAEAGR